MRRVICDERVLCGLYGNVKREALNCIGRRRDIGRERLWFVC